MAALVAATSDAVLYVAHGLTEHAHDALPPLTWHTALTRWEFDAGITAGLVLAALAYVYGVLRVRRAHPARPWPLARTSSYLFGLVVLAFATQGSVGAYDDLLFYMHMWQHLLLIMVVPPLLLAGRPVTLLLHASKNPLHTWVKRAIRSRLATAVTFPLVGVAFYIGVVVATHLTGFMNVTLTNPSIHYLEHGLYLLAGYLYFLPLVGHEPTRWRLTYPAQLFLLVIAMPVDTFTGVVLMQTNHPLFPAYVGRRNWGPSVVDDLHAGGGVMWIAGDGIMFLLIIILFMGVVRRGVQFNAGSWLEAVRTNRFRDLTSVEGAAGSADPAAALANSPRENIVVDDDDEAQLAAYNEYLARLHEGPGSPAGSAR
jgi:cytochrome c oxidase assembly factor CtaG